MHGFFAVFRKEMSNFFISPIAYSIIAIFLLISGLFFAVYVWGMADMSMKVAGNPMYAERINSTDLIVRPLVQNMAIILLFVMPLLTMRLFSEEKKSGTIELLLTYPIDDSAFVFGKFLAALALLIIMLLGTFTFPILLASLTQPDFGVMTSGYLGLFLMGAAFMALGTFISSLTENQIVASAISFGAAILFWVLSWTSSFVSESTGAVIKQLSILEHLESFNKGVLTAPDLSFFILFIAFFLFLSLRSLETHRWRG